MLEQDIEVDRKDLDRQTREEFNRFQEGCVEENTNTAALVRRLLSSDYADKVIVTTSQGATDVLYWTTLSQVSLERSGLLLTDGRAYWLSVQARNLLGVWGASGYGSFVAGQPQISVFIPMVSK